MSRTSGTVFFPNGHGPSAVDAVYEGCRFEINKEAFARPVRCSAYCTVQSPNADTNARGGSRMVRRYALPARRRCHALKSSSAPHTRTGIGTNRASAHAGSAAVPNNVWAAGR